MADSDKHAHNQTEIDQGIPFNPQTAERVAQRQLVKSLCREMNAIPPENFKARQQLARRLFARVDGCYIEPDFYCDYGCNIHLGKRFFANHHCIILDAATITIGDNVLLGPGVQLLTVNHPLSAAERRQGWEIARPITLGNDVWIGAGALILGGVTLGDGCVVAAGSVVTRSFEAGQLIAGNPAVAKRQVETGDAETDRGNN